MGQLIKTNEYDEYQQADGRVTAVLYAQEKKALSHPGSDRHKRILWVLTIMGLIYLLAAFALVR